jgi:eukaryotic-like serine/threonine-protein kinase
MPEAGESAIDKGSGLKAGDLVAGRYRIERILGSGGMGFVVAAIDETNAEPVAVKLLRSVDDRRAVERFFREARAMGSLASKHVVRVRDSGTAAGNVPYLVMDRLEGVDLSARAKQAGPLDVREAADYLLQACEALSHAHAKGIVHRDVKPSNLFLHTEGGATVLKVLDFGISKVQSRDVWERTLTATDDGGVLGSPPYMSPEQVRDPKAVDARSDVWSLGIVLYKILSGNVPYDGESVGEVFSKVLECPYPSLRITTNLPEEVDAIVAKCLAKNRHDRWADVGELATALAPFATPEHGALAPRIVQRMHDEAPTVDRPSSLPDTTPVSRDRQGEPKTMTLSEPPPPLAPAGAATTLSEPPPRFPSTTAPSLTGINTGSVSLDVVPVAPGRARIAMLLAGLGIAVAAGVGIGLSMRGGASGPANAASDPGVTTVASTPTATGPEPTASSTSTSTSTSTTTSTTASAPTVASSAGKGRRLRKPGAGTAASATARPELQPSPYPTAP